MSQPRQTAWTPLLDRLEARLHRLQTLAANPGDEWAYPGPDPTMECVPMVPPTGFERVRLSIILPAHREAQARLQLS